MKTYVVAAAASLCPYKGIILAVLLASTRKVIFGPTKHFCGEAAKMLWLGLLKLIGFFFRCLFLVQNGGLICACGRAPMLLHKIAPSFQFLTFASTRYGIEIKMLLKQRHFRFRQLDGGVKLSNTYELINAENKKKKFNRSCRRKN